LTNLENGLEKLPKCDGPTGDTTSVLQHSP